MSFDRLPPVDKKLSDLVEETKKPYEFDKEKRLSKVFSEGDLSNIHSIDTDHNKLIAEVA
jgi:hypothetical protein